MSTNRREHLREYILACVRDNVFSFSDLAKPDIMQRLLGAVSSDVRLVVTDLVRAGAGSALRMIGDALSSKVKR